MRAPLVIAFVFFAAGICADRFANIPLGLSLALLAASFLLVFLLMRGKHFLCSTLSLFALLFAAGAIDHNARFKILPANEISHFLGKERALSKIEGRISSQVETYEIGAHTFNRNRKVKGTRFLLKARRARTESGDFPIQGKIQVFIYDWCEKIGYGDIVEIAGWIYSPSKARNPGGFDYAAYLNRKEIRACINAEKSGNIRVIKRERSHPLRLIYDFKKWLLSSIGKNLDDPARSLLACMVLGERKAISQEMRRAFIRTGAYHFLVVSGLHLAIILSFFYLLFRLIKIGTKLSAMLLVPVIMFYTALTGFPPSIARAGTMAIALVAAYALGRPYSSLNALALSGLLIIAIFPGQLFDIGFQLSYTAVLFILVLAKPIRDLLLQPLKRPEPFDVLRPRRTFRQFAQREVAGIIAVSAAAWFGIFPIQAYYFHQVTPGLIILNLLIFPLVWLGLVVGFLFVLTGPFLCAAPIVAALQFVFSSLYEIVKRTADFPACRFFVSKIHPLWIFLAYGILLLLILHKRLKVPGRLLVIILAAAAISFGISYGRPPDKDFEMTVLDVGRGEAVFIRFPDGKTLLFDAGSTRLSDVGEWVVARFLWEKRVRKIDLLVLSHPHLDHFSGIPSLLERFKVKEVLASTAFVGIPNGSRLLGMLSQRAVPTHFLSGEKNLAPGLTAYASYDEHMGANEQSVSLLIEYEGKKILITGDIQEAGIEELLSKAPLQNLDIVLLPHHGRRAENLERFILRARPAVAVLSTSKSFEDERTLHLLERMRVKTFSTAECGAVIVRMRNGLLEIEPFLARSLPQRRWTVTPSGTSNSKVSGGSSGLSSTFVK